MKIEKWKDICGYEGLYRVSTFGRVESLSRWVRHWRGGIMLRKGLTLKTSGEYPIVALCKDGVVKYRQVHSLVAETFIPNPMNKPTVNHKDGDKTNNHVDNLEWATHSEQTRHALENGLYVPRRGSQVVGSVFTEEQVTVIKERLRRGEQGRVIARDYGQSETLVSMIKHGHIWRHVK